MPDFGSDIGTATRQIARGRFYVAADSGGDTCSGCEALENGDCGYLPLCSAVARSDGRSKVWKQVADPFERADAAEAKLAAAARAVADFVVSGGRTGVDAVASALGIPALEGGGYDFRRFSDWADSKPEEIGADMSDAHRQEWKREC